MGAGHRHAEHLAKQCGVDEKPQHMKRCPFCGAKLAPGLEGAYVHPNSLSVTTDSKEMARRNRERCILNGAVILPHDFENWNRRASGRLEMIKQLCEQAVCLPHWQKTILRALSDEALDE